MALSTPISVPQNTAPPNDGEVYIKHVEFNDKDETTFRFEYKKLDDTLLFEYLKRHEPSFRERLMTVSFNTSMVEVENVNFCKKVLTKGIFCEGKQHRFLGHSDSQLRQKTCYLMNASDEEIHKCLARFADFDQITDLRLRAKRIGMLFSTFEKSLELNKNVIKIERDIKGGGIFRKHTFSSGCGFMFPEFSYKIRSQLTDVHYPEPSVVLVRYQGFEGMLVLKEERTNVPHQVQFHWSMQKFAIPDDAMRQAMPFICIVDHSRPRTIGYLDAQLVRMLMARGVSVEYLKDLQKDYYSLLKSMCEDPASAELFLHVTGRDLSQAADLNESLPALRRAEIEEMVDYVHEPGNEPPRRLVARTRILVPEARVVFGVCDPYNKLNYGECYFKPTLLHDQGKTFEGCKEVVVARSPCYHPGDIQVLKLAHEKRGYEHLTDCLVLPVKGPRPHAFECGGADLGGTKFFVSWDTNLIPKIDVKPCSYLPTTREKASQAWAKLRSYVSWIVRGRPRKSEEESRKEMMEYFASYTDDLLRCIDKSYMQFARASGPLSKECKHLSNMFYQAANLMVDKNVLELELEQMESTRSPSSGDESLTEFSGLLENVDNAETPSFCHGNREWKEFDERASRFVEEVRQKR